MVFLDNLHVHVLVRKLGHPTQFSTQVQLVATCDYLQVRLTRVLPLLMFLCISSLRNYMYQAKERLLCSEGLSGKSLGCYFISKCDI